MNIEAIISKSVVCEFKKLYDQKIDQTQIQIQKTRKDFKGDYTVVVFPLLRFSKKSPEITANELGTNLKKEISEIKDFNVVKGFLNLDIDNIYWLNQLKEIKKDKTLNFLNKNSETQNIVIEFSSPNTNKPLHLGHIRNNLLGESLSRILVANGHQVSKVNLVNDRGIHICKSMLAWNKWGNNETPESSGIKGDHLIGKYYVLFDQKYKEEVEELKKQGYTEEEAKKEAPLIKEAQKMLRKWERKNKRVLEIWKKLNSWVYDGFDETYKNLGITFDKIYYESETYMEGKTQVLSALKRGLLHIKDNDSVFIDLSEEDLDEKILLRSDGTSVYMTQDIGTAIIRYEDFNFDKQIYVVGNEQNYHFKVLKIILQKIGYEWAENLIHFSYGMVELPEGKMKSREGTVVDADNLIEEMILTATQTSRELGKLEDYSKKEQKEIIKKIAMGALKYFILKVDPKKNMTFNPKESIDFNGNTGPFIQYTYARIQSIFRKFKELNLTRININENCQTSDKEINLIKSVFNYSSIISEAGQNHSPALISNYLYNLSKDFNQFYHDSQILKEKDENIRELRLTISESVSNIIKHGLYLLGIETPDRM